MPNSENTIVVAVRIRTSDAKALQILALVYNRTVGEIIREAVKKHVQTIVNSEEFRSTESTPTGLLLETLDKLVGKKSKPARKPRAARKHKL